MAGVAINETPRGRRDPRAATDTYRAFFTGWFGQGSWFERSQAPDAVTYSRDHFYTWEVLVSILLFPIGLLSLLAEKEHFNAAASFSELDKGSTKTRLSGVLPQRVAGQWHERLAEFREDQAAE